ncbi:MAG: ArsR family transcriptional regulator [Chloroflexi bacterium CFX1]|nr:ArsR family transcriptional regulator [Chloroflexi bacterium CFX1]
MKLSPVLFAKAIADETRQNIMKLVCCKWLSVSEIVEKVGYSQPTISHHLAILRDAGLVNIREEGKQTFYSLNQENIAVCCGQLMIKFAPENKVTEAFSCSPADFRSAEFVNARQQGEQNDPIPHPRSRRGARALRRTDKEQRLMLRRQLLRRQDRKRPLPR